MLAKLDFAMLILLELSCGGVEYDFSVISMHALRKHLRAVVYSTARSTHSRFSVTVLTMFSNLRVIVYMEHMLDAGYATLEGLNKQAFLTELV